MTRPDVSVVIPTYGRPQYLHAAVASVLAQSVSLECVVVDDASPDPVPAVDDDRVTVIRLPVNSGPAAARNEGIRRASGEFIAFLDDDDVWEPRRLERALQAAKSASAVVCWSRYLDGPPNPGRLLEGSVHDVILDGMVPSLGATLVRRSLAPWFDTRFDACEDVEWWLRASEALELATVPSHDHLVRRHPEVRDRTGADRRIRDGARLLELHAAYFDDHPRAEAFRLLRIALTANAAGDQRSARQAMLRSFRRSPSLRSLYHLLRLTLARGPR